ncbi:MAG: DUF2891 domain-containing protein [Crocinitomicaceae bacterium]
MKKWVLIILLISQQALSQQEEMGITLQSAEKLVQVPLDCIEKEYPNKLNQVLSDSTHLQSPRDLHPIFYGCFDWHSSVHGHWLMAKMMNKFPDSELAKKIINVFDRQFSIPNVQKELLYFQPKLNQSFERTYGWAWLLKLYAELHASPFNKEHQWTDKLQSLTDQVVKYYKLFLPKLLYPIRVGEHTNTAFGLSLTLDYAREVKDLEFENLIVERAKTYYLEDVNCPLNWEPSGFDFISPCLQEAELMAKILEQKSFKNWMKDYLPQVFEKEFILEPGKVLDRTDGKLVHLDGLNFSRAWCLYRIATEIPKHEEELIHIADQHIMTSQAQVIDSDYMGSHWLATFMVYALETRAELIKE